LDAAPRAARPGGVERHHAALLPHPVGRSRGGARRGGQDLPHRGDRAAYRGLLRDRGPRRIPREGRNGAVARLRARRARPPAHPLRPGACPWPLSLRRSWTRRTRRTGASEFSMTASRPPSTYVLGSTEAEHERLIRQAARVDPFTERLFRDAGIGPGQRVLDVGSGVGDVAMLAARLVGSSGEVVGVERDAGTIAKARARVAGAGLRNVTFLEADATHLPSGQAFDAAVGRVILQFLPNPTAVVRSLAAVGRPGGGLGFPEVGLTQALQSCVLLPLAVAFAS